MQIPIKLDVAVQYSRTDDAPQAELLAKLVEVKLHRAPYATRINEIAQEAAQEAIADFKA